MTKNDREIIAMLIERFKTEAEALLAKGEEKGGNMHSFKRKT